MTWKGDAKWLEREMPIFTYGSPQYWIVSGILIFFLLIGENAIWFSSALTFNFLIFRWNFTCMYVYMYVWGLHLFVLRAYSSLCAPGSHQLGLKLWCLGFEPGSAVSKASALLSLWPWGNMCVYVYFIYLGIIYAFHHLWVLYIFNFLLCAFSNIQ